MDSYPAEPTENTVECVKHVLCESSSEHEPVESSELSSLTSPCKKVKPKLNRILMKKAVLSAIATKARQTEQAYQFFSDNQFSRRFCAKFYSDNRDPEVCKGCGFPENEHVKILSPLNRWAADSLEWKPDFHLINEPYPNETLKIRLVDEPAGIDKSADLMIIADNTHPGMPVQVLVERWKVPVPDFIVSVIGTTHESPVTPEQFQYFKPDFNRAVSSSNVWVIGGGSLHGVDKLVSECLKEVQLQAWMGLSSKKLDVIGIVNWDCFESNHAANTLYFGSEYPMSRFSPDQKFSYFVKKRRPDWDAQTGKLSFTLNPLFTNFIAIQGGVKGKLHQETNLRSSIENLLSNPLLEKSLLENTKTIPQTLVVLGGDVGTLDHIANSLINGIPAVLCQGSGGITDVIIGALRMTKGSQGLLEYQKFVVIKRIRDLINQPKDDEQLFSADYMDAVTHVRNISVCIHLRDLLTIYRLDKPVIGSKLDQCILKSLLNGRAVANCDPVFLGLKWGKCEQVIKDTLLAEGDINSRHNIRALCRVAFLENQTEFIELFLGLDLDLCKYLNPAELHELYKNSIIKEKHMRRLFTRRGKFCLSYVYDVIFTTSTAYENFNVNELAISCQSSCHEAAIELFWWSIFNCRLQLSKFLWKMSQHQLSIALIAVSLCEICIHIIPESETAHLLQFRELQHMYETFALELLNQVWELNEKFTKELILHKTSTLIGTSIFEIALFTRAKDFISHVAVQICVDETWKSSLKYSYPKIMFATFAPFYAISDVRKAQLEIRAFWNQKNNSNIRKNSGVNMLDFENFLSKDRAIAESDPDNKTSSNAVSPDYELPNPSSKNEQDTNENVNRTNNKNKKKVHYSSRLASEPFIEAHKLRSKISNMSIFKCMFLFYTTPVVKFILHFFTYILFVGYYSWFLTHDAKDCPHSFSEPIIFLFNACYLIESGVLLLQFGGPFPLKLRYWLRCEWSYIQAASSFCGCMAYMFKLLCMADLSFPLQYGPALYAISGFSAWMRLLSFYRCSSRLGPLWILLRNMVREALGFMLIFSTVSIAAGIFINNFMDVYGYEDQYSSGIQWLWLRPFFMFTGENFLKTVSYNTMGQGGGENFLLFYSVVYIVYFLLGNALMLNLLVAIFSEIFNKVFAHSDREFKTEFLMLTKEYNSKTTIPVPFLFFELIYKLIKFIVSKYIIRPTNKNWKSDPSRLDERKIIGYFESQCANRVMSHLESRLDMQETVSYALKSIDEQQGRLADMKHLVQAVERQVDDRFSQERKKKYCK